jgi:hypothetical protein
MNTQMSVNTGLSAADYGGEPPTGILTTQVLRRQNLAFKGTGGVSAGNRSQGFAPAFLDMETGSVYLARFADGRPAPMHLLDGLPRELIVSRDAAGRCLAVKRSLVAGFVQADRFYTREQAACCV